MSQDKKSFPKRTFTHGEHSFSVVALPDGRSMFIDSKGRDIAEPQAPDVADDTIDKAKAFGYAEVVNA